MRWMNPLAVVAGSALATFLLVSALGRPGASHAEDEAPLLVQAKKAGVLEVDGATCRLELDRSSYEAGQRPVVSLHVENPSESAVDIGVGVRMTTTVKPPPTARMIPLPREVWSENVSLRLEPGETKAFELATEIALDADSIVTFHLQQGDENVIAARATAAAAPAAPPPVDLEPETAAVLVVEEPVAR